jgi:hypothetical protein
MMGTKIRHIAPLPDLPLEEPRGVALVLLALSVFIMWASPGKTVLPSFR